VIEAAATEDSRKRETFRGCREPRIIRTRIPIGLTSIKGRDNSKRLEKRPQKFGGNIEKKRAVSEFTVTKGKC